MSASIALECVRLRYRDQVVLDGLDLRASAGEVLAVLGPSGSGKTSALRTALGFALPESGTVRVADQVVTAAGRIVVPPEERRLAVVFQDLALWPHLTVAGNLSFGLEAQRVPARERPTRVSTILQRVGLSGSERRHPGELSGGQRQRVAIARALVLEPRAVLLDEPLAGVDVDLRRDLLGLLRELFRERGTTALYVTHDLREAASIADRFAILESGRVVQQGALGDLRRAPATPFVRSLVDDLAAGVLDDVPSGARGG